MSILLFNQTDTDVLLVTDTLVVDKDDKPAMHQSKVWPLPHMNMVIASTGSGNFVSAWYQLLTSRSMPADIESLNDQTPDALRRIHAALTEELGPLGHSTIYHFGFPAGSDKIVRYVYSTRDDFEPHRFYGPGFGAKPAPPGFRFEAPETRQDYVQLAERLRIENATLQGGVPIGGDLFATFACNWNIGVQRWHRFTRA